MLYANSLNLKRLNLNTSTASGCDPGGTGILRTHAALLAKPGNDEIQLDLFLDYASNVALYPAFQEYFRSKKPPLLEVWGNTDPFFLPAGAEAFRRDNLRAELRFYETGHFALETILPKSLALFGFSLIAS